MDRVAEQAALFMGATAAGELMLPWHGRITTDLTGNYIAYTGSEDGVFHSTSSIVSAQYVYTVPAEAANAFVPANTHAAYRHPGGIFARPMWTARQRKKNLLMVITRVLLPQENILLKIHMKTL